MKQNMRGVALVLALVLSCMTPMDVSYATERSQVDQLINTLVSKGILTQGEAIQLVEDARNTASVQQVQGGPEWVQAIKLKGDLRTRYQWQNAESSSNAHDTRHRGRIRFRLKAEAKVNDKTEVGFGFSSGGVDARSTNQTLGDSATSGFGRPDLRLDYAYAKYTPIEGNAISAGRMVNPLWCPSDLLWDTDINPDGVGVNFSYSPFENLTLFTNGAFLLISEIGGYNNDPVMFAAQPGFEVDLGVAKWKNAISLYGFNNMKTKTVSTEGNYNDINNVKYNSAGVSTELGFTFKNPILPYVALFGDGITNYQTSDKGYLGGVKFGKEKIKGFGDWQAKAMYRYLESNAWLDWLPDSDALGGNTDTKGAEFVLSLGLMKNMTLDLDYYACERIGKTGGNAGMENLFQCDLNYKF